MEEGGLHSGLNDASGRFTTEAEQETQEIRKLSSQRCVYSFVYEGHSCDAECHLPCCHRMKRILQHIKICIPNSRGECTFCKRFPALCRYHAKRCQVTKCPVPFCEIIKYKLKHRQLEAVMNWPDTREKILQMKQILKSHPKLASFYYRYWYARTQMVRAGNTALGGA